MFDGLDKFQSIISRHKIKTMFIIYQEGRVSELVIVV
jgi:hypothetical protein